MYISSRSEREKNGMGGEFFVCHDDIICIKCMHINYK